MNNLVEQLLKENGGFGPEDYANDHTRFNNMIRYAIREKLVNHPIGKTLTESQADEIVRDVFFAFSDSDNTKTIDELLDKELQ